MLLACHLSGRATGLGFEVQHLRSTGRTALVGQGQHLDFQPFLAAADLQPITHMQRLGRLAAATIDVDLASVDRLLGQAARLEETCSP